MKKNVNYKYINILLILGIIYLLFLMRSVWINVAMKIFQILLPFIIAFIISYVLYPFLKFLMNKKFPKSISVIIIIFIVLLIVCFAIYYVVPIFFNQLINLLSNLGKVSINIANKYNIDMDFIDNAISKYSSKILESIGNIISDGTFIGVLNKSIDYVSKFIIIFIVSIYFLIDMPKIRSKIKEYLLKKDEKSYYLILKIDNEITSYLKGLGIFMIIQFFEYTFLFLIIGHPNYLLLGFLACITTVIPYFGGLITNVIAILIASVISTKLLVLTVIITLVFPNIDAYIISPKIYGKTNQLPAVLSIFSVFAGGALFGFAGIIIGVPLTVIIISIIKVYKSDILDKITNIKDKI